MISIILILTLLAVTYFYMTRNLSYWKRKGVKHDKPIPIFGNNLKGFLFKESLSQSITEQYRKYPEERVVGYMRMGQPELIIRDTELVKRVLITDFSYFHKRLNVGSDNMELIMKNLFTVEGDLWRLLRQRLTPAFTSGKLKAMFPLIVERAELLYTRILAAGKAPIDARDLMARFATDFIGAVGFGLETDALQDDESAFRKLGVSIFKITPSKVIKGTLKSIFPTVLKYTNTTKDIEDIIVPIVQNVVKKRNYQPSGRNDFIDLLLECKKKGVIVGESIEKFKPDGTPEKATLEMTDEILAAQAFVFFAAGFETSSSTSSFTLHLLAYHPEIQKKVQEKIDNVLSKYDNKLCYDAVREMDYLEWTFKESMRILPAIGFLIRTCVRKYKFPDMDLTIDEGVKVVIPMEALQHDPQYFEDPEQFRPERFDPQNISSEKTKYAYLPFGEGPRACIGERLGLMQSLAGLAVVLSKFSVEPAPNSVRHPAVDTYPAIVQSIKAGLPLIFRERKKEQ